MDRRDAVRLSKFLSLVLRHRPDEYGLEMDEQGYVDFDSLMDVLAAEDVLGGNAEEDVRALVEGSERRRFAIDDTRIRALYGHSARIRLDYPADDPPPTLYHGTTAESARRVLQEGLKPVGRAFVHLSGTEEEAIAVGSRHTERPVLIRIDTEAAAKEGIDFHRATDLIWLCRVLPPGVCQVPDLPAPASRPEPSSGGPRVVQPDTGEGFKRRTRKKSR
jgi:putative RNA 2'-phosphotransferase